MIAGNDDSGATPCQGADVRIDRVVRAEVARLHEDWLRDPAATPERRAQLIAAEARELTVRVRTVEAALLGQQLRDWRALYRRYLPPQRVMTTFTVLARSNARRAVLCADLYSRLPAAVVADRHRGVDGPARRGTGADPGRWRAAREEGRADPEVERIWGLVHTADFALLAAALLRVRAADGLPLPLTPLDPLAATLTAMIHDELRARGLPPV
ncbi:hypothetical protein [Nocardia thailandica]|uniref:hypothetical protein n=1 Tax=Nocardia thailandica TaxID=257275 RepID=UPI0002EAB0D6|nr:hypothetical protein [Nocardia thailandica]